MANNERKVKVNVDVKTEDAEKKFKELSEQAKKIFTSGNKLNIGKESIGSLKELTSAYKDIITTRGTFRKEALKDVDFFKRRLSELATAISQGATSTGNKISLEAKKSAKEVSKIAKQLGGEIEDVAKKSSGVAQFLDSFRYRAGVFVSYRAINSLANAITSTKDAVVNLESEFANIQAITSASDADMDKLRKTILRVGEASKFSSEEIAKSTVMLGQAGLSAEEINDALETTTQLAAATGSNLSNTVDLMTSALAVWGLNSEEASHLSDIMVTGMNRTKATLDTFRMSVQYAGATMASLNGSFEELAATSAAAANAGLRASVVGTGLRATIAELTSPTTKMVKGLAKLGLSTEDVNIRSKGLIQVLKNLKEAGLDASNAYEMFGRRAVPFVLGVQGQLDVVDDLTLAFEQSGATLLAYEKQMDTVGAKLTSLGNTIKEIAYSIYDSTNGPLKSAIDLIRNGLIAMGVSTEDYEKRVEDSIKNVTKSSESFIKYINKLQNSPAKITREGLNDLINKINLQYADWRKYGLEMLPLVDKTEDLGDALERILEYLRDINKESAEAYNVSQVEKREKYLNEAYSKVSSPFANNYENVINPYVSGYTSLDEALKDRIQRFESEYEVRLKRGENKDVIKQEAENTADEVERKIRLASLEAANNIVNYVQEAIENTGKVERSEKYKELEARINDVNTSIFNKYMDASADISQLTWENIENDIKIISAEEYGLRNINEKGEKVLLGFDKILEDLNSSYSEDEKQIEKGEYKTLVDRLNAAKKSFSDEIKRLLEKGIKTLTTAGYVSEALNLETKQNELFNIPITLEDVVSQKAKLEKFNKQNARDTARTAKEAERERARRFNQKYQRFSLQTQADSYAQDIAEAQRKGVISKLQTQETTGDLSSYYSTVAADLSKLESLKTALANKKTFEAYQKDYGDIFKQVRDGQVTLEDAEYKTDGVISKMIELDKNIKSAEAEFGDLNSIDLSDIDSQITTLNEKLKVIGESGESEFSKLKMGFAATVESMSKSYSSAKIGSTIAEDFGNGMSDALYSVADGTKSMKEAFSDMARSILQDISKMLIKMSVLKAMEMGVGMFFGGGEQPVVAGGESGTGAIYGGVYGNGGFVPKLRAAAGKLVRGGIEGRDSVPAMVMPGEYILKKSAVDALGTNFLNDLNNNAAQTLAGTAASLAAQNPWEESSDSEPAVVNVWVVSKEEEAQMGPNDIIATIGKDIMTGGQTRRLIQSVVAGRK